MEIPRRSQKMSFALVQINAKRNQKMLIDDIVWSEEDIAILKDLLSKRPDRNSQELNDLLWRHSDNENFFGKLRQCNLVEFKYYTGKEKGNTHYPYSYNVGKIEGLLYRIKTSNKVTRCLVWYFSHWWSVPVALIVVGVPWAKGVWEFIATLIG